ncbi:IpaD/SipD/SspD family type III secretion system needle tip protein [Citrobacter sp. JGM124]|uniref:IpaD/SipD/SspD family type III secretion system needle tip protein n=1 Tax=Citrobacter sp. JGM124 TaxID=2799789 RepID=UPI0020114045|nr:IpaD/SipD/SspD family type III secretion system needle tip protein [Citrobacter sp. JGM124]
MNPELNNAHRNSMPLPDIITSHVASLPDVVTVHNDLSSLEGASALNDHTSLSKNEINKLCNDVVGELLRYDTDRINKIADLFDRSGWKNIRPGNPDHDIQSMIDNLSAIQSYIIKGSNNADYMKGLFYARSEQLSRIHDKIRNQLLYQKYSVAQLQPMMNRGQAQQSDEASYSQQQRGDNRGGEQITTGTSYSEIWRRLAMAIGEIKTDYVDFYADLMQSYTEMYESFNENVQKASANAVTAGDDGNNVTFDKDIMQAGYDSFQKDVDKLNKELGSVKGWSSMTNDSKISMKTTLEPAFKIDDAGNITFNMDQYNSVSGTYPAGINNSKVSTASYQAWLASFNAAGNAFQSNMQSFAQRYSQANNTFDNINKVLSGAISALGDSARDVLKSLS